MSDVDHRLMSLKSSPRETRISPDPTPSDLAEGDFVVWQGMGSYSTVTNTRFNGFGELQMATVLSLKL